MPAQISLHSRIPARSDVIYLVSDISQADKKRFSAEELKYLRKEITAERQWIGFNRITHWEYVYKLSPKGNISERLEKSRIAGSEMTARLKAEGIDRITLAGQGITPSLLLSFAEGMALSSYQFRKYKTKNDKESKTLREIHISPGEVEEAKITELNVLINAVCMARDLVNEPVSYLNAEQLAAEIEEMGRACGARVEVLNKKKLQVLRMGGLLAVNQGSPIPPTFTIFEWKPEKPVNTKPIILVGKGVVYDTGGLSLKPTTGMETMKCDMAGAAAVAAAVFAAATMKIPVHVIALVPATDNRPDGLAYAPGDVVKMFDGSTVEVLNTDAEGRMILADALSYAKKYKPSLVIDLATLTGSASRAIGKYGIVAMQARARREFDILVQQGESSGERLVEFPFWDEYAELLKSEVADIKNIGGLDAGAITAGKFLEKFTDYPYIHLDIAGPAFVEQKYNYRGIGGTGVGVRLLYSFLSHKAGRRTG